MVVPLDKDVDVDATAPVGCAVMTGVGAAINAAMVRPGESCAIIGVGGVGLSVVAGCAIAGAYPIIAIDLSDDKLEFAKQFGATHGINAAKEDPIAKVREMMGGGFNAGVDHAFDAIGAQDQRWSRCCRWPARRRPGDREGGQAILVGVPHGEPATPPMFMLFGGKVYRGAPGGCSDPGPRLPDDDPLVQGRQAAAGPDGHADATSWSRSTRPAATCARARSPAARSSSSKPVSHHTSVGAVLRTAPTDFPQRPREGTATAEPAVMQV